MARPRKPPPVAADRPDFGRKVRDRLIETGIVTALGNPNWMEFAHSLDGVSYESLRKAVTGDRFPGNAIMEVVATALQLDVQDFWEYRLNQLRSKLDPTDDPDVAYETLRRIEEAR